MMLKSILAALVLVPTLAFAAPATVKTTHDAARNRTLTTKSWTLRGGTQVKHEIVEAADGSRVSWSRTVARKNGHVEYGVDYAGRKYRTSVGSLGGAQIEYTASDRADSIIVRNANGKAYAALLPTTMQRRYPKSMFRKIVK
jgi:hypothetical protein